MLKKLSAPFVHFLLRASLMLRPYRRPLFAAFLLCASVSLIMFASGCAGASFVTDLESVIPVALSGLSGILTILAGVDPALAPVIAIVNPLVAKIQANLQTVEQLQAQYKSNASEGTLADIESLIATSSADLKTLLATDGLPAAEAAQISAVATAIDTELQALLSTLPVLQASTAGATLTVTKPSATAAFKSKIETALKSAA